MPHRQAIPTILVTGATGFLGGAIVSQLRRRDCRLRTTGRRRLAHDLPDYRSADLSDNQAAADLVRGADVLIHAAGLAHVHGAAAAAEDDFHRVNVCGTENLLRAAANSCRRVVLVSSVSVYGSGSPKKSEIDECRPNTSYGRSKLAAERVATDISNSAGLELAILRMATIYGPDDPGNVGRLIRAIKQRRFLWIGEGANAKSLIHVDDAALACVAAAFRSPWPGNGPYNVAASPSTMREVVETIAAAVGRRPPPVRLPAAISLRLCEGAARAPFLARPARRAVAALDKWLADDVYDGASFGGAFGWRPTASLHEALAREARRSRDGARRAA